MAKEYIEREAFLAGQRHLYCENCERRKGMKNGKMKFVYAIGDAPCRACDIGDVLDSVEDFPAADVVEVRHGRLEKKQYAINWSCSLCGNEPFHCHLEHMNYCPNCGARMDGDGDA